VGRGRAGRRAPTGRRRRRCGPAPDQSPPRASRGRPTPVPSRGSAGSRARRGRLYITQRPRARHAPPVRSGRSRSAAPGRCPPARRFRACAASAGGWPCPIRPNGAPGWRPSPPRAARRSSAGRGRGATGRPRTPARRSGPVGRAGPASRRRLPSVGRWSWGRGRRARRERGRRRRHPPGGRSGGRRHSDRGRRTPRRRPARVGRPGRGSGGRTPPVAPVARLRRSPVACRWGIAPAAAGRSAPSATRPGLRLWSRGRPGNQPRPGRGRSCPVGRAPAPRRRRSGGAGGPPAVRRRERERWSPGRWAGSWASARRRLPAPGGRPARRRRSGRTARRLTPEPVRQSPAGGRNR